MQARLLYLLAILLITNSVLAESKTNPKSERIGIDYKKLGTTIPMDIPFTDHNGRQVTLAELAKDKPIVLAPVYYSCTSICNPLLHGITTLINNSPASFLPGVSYTLVSFSFNPDEKSDIAASKREALLNSLDKTKQLTPDSWYFLTGDQESINRLTSAIGFHYRKEGDAYNHPASLIIISQSGIIARYLRGLKFLPLDLMMAVTDAMEGRWAPTIKKIAKFCFVKDPQGRGYYFDFLKVAGVLILLSIAITITTLTIILNKKRGTKAIEVAAK
ncbi:MAG: SCO family protein [Bdellovibrionales bacterium]|nr:SCO family protein [Bdellovibrionales bacterium]MBT3527003.1 SCO family protein [Bdellovibrionales bacterium]MBT7669508.1 SCO family protein [Bdellovibrionales bacterium]MBT7766332.1 SCO family protein [Bdellovibrionales bacterium]